MKPPYIYDFIKNNSALYLIFIFTMIWASIQFSGQAALFLFPQIQDPHINQTSAAEIFFSTVASPIIETAILAYCLLIAKQIIRNRNLSIMCAIIPVCLLHAFTYWQLAFIVATPFFFQAIGYTYLREKYSAFRSTLTIATLHSLANLLTLYLTNSF